MRLPYKIALISVLIALLFSFAFSFGGGEKGLFILIFGAACVLFGGVQLLLAGILHLAKNRQWSKGMLLSAGILFLLGLGICGPLLMDVNGLL